jgi:hypothetical protein
LVKRPLPPEAGELQRNGGDIKLLAGVVLWRIHRTSGDHVTPWNQLRYYGPVASMRFDPHELPAQFQTSGVTYTALDLPTALAEVFQLTRFINAHHGDPYLTGWAPTRDLQLLDITGSWPIRNGSSFTLNTGRKDHCRAWARAIHSAWPDLDGLWHDSSLTGRAMATLFTHASDSFPVEPSFSEPLSHPGLFPYLQASASDIGFALG